MPRLRFSDKYGFTKPRDIFQIKDIDDTLRNRLWNTVKVKFIDVLVAGNYDSESFTLMNSKDKDFIVQVYDSFFKDHIDPLQFSKSKIRADIKERFFKLEWHDTYNLLEFLPCVYHSTNRNYYNYTNQVLEEENSAYRFVDEYITPIVDEIEIISIEDAMGCEYLSVKRHLSKAIELFSDKETPDYVNSIKESISAVESVCQHISSKDNDDLGKCLKNLELTINKQFRTSMINLYGWTSKEDGIRHAYTGAEIETSFSEAKYMLVACSAFVNYLIEKQNYKE